MFKSIWVRLTAALILICAVTAAAMSTVLSVMPHRAAMVQVEGRNSLVLILDAGHGGADGGAVSVTGAYESRLNLEIVLKARALAELYGIEPVLTREREDIDYPEEAKTIHAKKVADTKAREKLINSLENAVLISIHQNKYTTSGPKGSQVFYAPSQGSQEFADILQSAISEISENNKRGVVRIGKDVYLMNHIECPGVLIECGFVSNPAEARLLESQEYQLKLAAAIVGGYIQSIS